MCLVKVYLKYIIIIAFQKKKEKERDVVIAHDQNQKSCPSITFYNISTASFVVKISIAPHFIRFQNFLVHNFCDVVHRFW